MRHGIVLSGGGAFAAFEIGVLRVLARGLAATTDGKKLEISVLTGASSGAFNAAILAAQGTASCEAAVAHLEKIWVERISGEINENGVFRIRCDAPWLLDPSSWLFPNPGRFLQLAGDATIVSADFAGRVIKLGFGDPQEPLSRRVMNLFEIGSLISTEPFHQLVRDTISGSAIRQSPQSLWIGTTNWVSGKLRAFQTADMTDEMAGPAVLASGALPGLFPPIMIGGEPYVDGGVTMNTPLKPAIDAGADVIHAICLDPDVSQLPLKGLSGVLDSFERYLNITNAQRLNDDIRDARRMNALTEVARKSDGEPYRRITVHRYAPDLDLGGLLGLLDFRLPRIRSLIAAGEKAALTHNCATDGCVLAPA